MHTIFLISSTLFNSICSSLGHNRDPTLLQVLLKLKMTLYLLTCGSHFSIMIVIKALCLVNFFSTFIIIVWVFDSRKAPFLMLSWIYECLSFTKGIHLFSGLCPFWMLPP